MQIVSQRSWLHVNTEQRCPADTFTDGSSITLKLYEPCTYTLPSYGMTLIIVIRTWCFIAMIPTAGDAVVKGLHAHTVSPAEAIL